MPRNSRDTWGHQKLEEAGRILPWREIPVKNLIFKLDINCGAPWRPKRALEKQHTRGHRKLP